MGHKKTAIRQNVLDGDNLPNAILNAVIAGYDVATIVNDTIEVLQQGETTSYMFEATPDAIEQFADAFVSKVKGVADELRGFEYIDKPVIRRRDEGAAAQPDARVGGESAGGEPADAEALEGIEIESAEEPELSDEPLGDEPLGDELGGDPGAVEKTVRKVAVTDLEIDAILATQEPIGDGRFTGKVAIKFPGALAGLGASVPGVLSRQGVDPDELADAVVGYTLDFISRNAAERFDGLDPDTANRTLTFTGMEFSDTNDSAIVSTFEVGGEG